MRKNLRDRILKGEPNRLNIVFFRIETVTTTNPNTSEKS